jgi:hypothetical protein
MRWEGHVASMGEKRNAHGIFVAKQKERDHEEDIGIGGSIILQEVLGRTNCLRSLV